MKLVVDMNLPPAWVEVLLQAGHEALHWSTVGAPRAADVEIMRWARENGCVVFTHDLDFTTVLALTGAGGPSVIQVRTQDVTPAAIGTLMLSVLRDHGDALARGAVASIDEAAARVRLLPLR